SGNPLVFPNMVMNAPLSYAAIELGVTGPAAMLTEQEASGEAAIAWGARLVADGRAEVCLAGGGDELTPELERILDEAHVAAAAGDRPPGAPAAGPCPAEGAAVPVLGPLDAARSRGARVYARLAPDGGFGVPAPVHGWPRDAAAIAAGLAPLVADADVVVA